MKLMMQEKNIIAQYFVLVFDFDFWGGLNSKEKVLFFIIFFSATKLLEK